MTIGRSGSQVIRNENVAVALIANVTGGIDSDILAAALQNSWLIIV